MYTIGITTKPEAEYTYEEAVKRVELPEPQAVGWGGGRALARLQSRAASCMPEVLLPCFMGRLLLCAAAHRAHLWAAKGRGAEQTGQAAACPLQPPP